MGCKRRNHIHQVIGVALLLILTIGCSSGGRNSPPTIPEIDESISPGHVTESNRFLWSYNLIRVDPSTHEFEVIPVRDVQAHWNVLQFLEQRPCNNCLRISGVTANPDGTLNVDVMIRHPFISLNLTGFDVRGIAMFRGSHLFPESGLVVSDRTMSDAELLNADGYTSLYNPTTIDHGLKGYIEGRLASPNIPDATLNGYKRFISDDPANTRNAFYADDEVTVTYLVHMPDSLDPWAFGYAVDASWAPPINKPVDDPMTDFGPDANCPEPWKIEVDDIGPGLKPEGGTTKLQIDVYDWQGKDDAHPVLVECPELFDDAIEAAWVSDEDGFTRYEAQIENAKLAPVGRYSCLVSKEAGENDPGGKPWLDLTAYLVFPVNVGWFDGYPIEVTPPWLNFFPMDVHVDGNYAYIAGDEALHIFDISNPENPVWIYRVDTPGAARAVVISGDYAYVADGDSGLQIIDVSTPESAYIFNSVQTPYTALEVAVSGGYAYVVDGNLQVIDIDPPESAHLIKSVDQTYFAQGVAVLGDYAYVVSNSKIQDYLYALDINDIESPESTHIVNSVSAHGRVGGVAVSGSYVYVTSSMELEIIEVDPPESAYIVNTIEVSGGIAVSGDYAYVADNSALHIIDIHAPESACIVKSVDCSRLGGEVAVSGGYVYVANRSGFRVIDIEPLESAHFVTSIDNPGYADRVAVSGDYAYVAGGSILQIIDIDPPESAYVLETVDIPYSARGVAVSGDYAYVTGFGGLHIIDIDPPESAYIVNSVDTPGFADGIAVSAGYAYVADGDSGLQIIDIDPPGSAYIVNSVETTDSTMDVAVSGDYAYALEPLHPELDIIDINPPESAYIVKSVEVWWYSSAVEASGGYAYVTDGNPHTDGGTIKIFDTDPPESSHLVSSIGIPHDGYGFAVSDGFAYIACHYNTPTFYSELAIVDISPPLSAHYVSSFDTCMHAVAVAVSDGYAFVAYGPSGLRIFQLW